MSEDQMKFEITRRVDGMYEVSGCGISARLATEAECDAYVEGLRAGLGVARNRLRNWEIDDWRPVLASPMGES